MRDVVVRRRGVARQISRDPWACTRYVKPVRQGGDVTTEEFTGRVQALATSRRYFGSSNIHEEHDAASSRWIILTEPNTVETRAGDEVLAVSSVTIDGEVEELSRTLFVIKHDHYSYKDEILCEERV